MSTAWDLLIVTKDDAAGTPVDADDLSLALAGAELLDLVDSPAAALDGDRIVPGPPVTTSDSLLDQAAAALVRQEPYETVDQWLWRRGEKLSSAYTEALETQGYAVRPHHRWLPGRSDRAVLVDSPARERAAERWASGEPVLSVLAAAVGVPGGEAGRPDSVADEDGATVLAAVGNAVTELEAERQRRRIENDAFDNIWRAP
ncbi:GOLPH3/VPS74 family protein [Actinacidiphila acidipaludis]|uniref:GPP34 family phosphoprotein n=1 Tax=Actinacidiphila acidipaludis TaxID=2873382 RepID=A0ABS7QAC7_9ACTN|nr:GPP34 family phosphoprotein [Streptomyces acidipaludis]MBY8880132.1 GPP34 family phosphoprotein [Streptomyces acidipaludis]